MIQTWSGHPEQRTDGVRILEIVVLHKHIRLLVGIEINQEANKITSADADARLPSPSLALHFCTALEQPELRRSDAHLQADLFRLLLLTVEAFQRFPPFGFQPVK